MLGTNPNTQTQSDLTKLFQGLFPSWPTMLATMLAITVLMVVLTKYLWKPMKKYVTNRSNFIQVNINNSIDQETKAIEHRKAAEKELSQARIEANQIINIAKTEAKYVKDESITETNQQIEQMIKSARETIAKEKARLKEESKEEIINVAFAVAEKILEKNIDKKMNKKIIEDFIKKDDK